jgi:hypothetical protein
MKQHYVYIYRDDQQRARYVGRGTSVSRAEHHVDSTHNAGLRSLISSGKYSIEVAGPYRDLREVAAVESALISALVLRATPDLSNKGLGDGPTFRPLGVPSRVAQRLGLDELTLGQLGRQTGGALIVRLGSGSLFKRDPTRPRFDPAAVDDEVIAENLRQWWQLSSLTPGWIDHPSTSPRVLIGLGGRLDRRYVVAASAINTKGWASAERKGRSWSVPVRNRTSLDTGSLRGRKVRDARFAQGRHHHFIWVDGRGVVRYQAGPRGTTVRR